MTRNLLIFSFILLLSWGCVEVEDVLPPGIFVEATDGIVDVDTVYYQDSLKFTVVFNDNVSINRSIVAITPLGVEVGDSVTNWIVFVTEPDTLTGSRQVTRNIAERVPTVLPKDPATYTPTGKYVVSLFVEDKTERSVAFADTFLLVADIQKPEFVDLSIDLEIRNDNLFTCPGFSIPISGGLKDNTQLRRIGYYINDNTPFSLEVNTGELEFDSISVGDSFSGSRSISIPDSLNNQIVEVTIFAEDVFRNIQEQTFSIEVDCDTKGPEVEILGTRPLLNDENIAFVVVDQQFNLDSVRFTDESAIDSVEVYFGLQGNTPSRKTFSFDPPVPEVMLDINDNLIYPDATTGFPQAGLTYIVSIRAFDTVTLFSNTGNVSESTEIELIIKQDDPVNIAALDIVLNESDVTDTTLANVDTATIYTLSVADDFNDEVGFTNTIIPDGKAEDDLGIEGITMRWTDPNGEILFENIASLSPTEFVIKLRDFHQNQLVFDPDLKGIYVLEIELTDAKRTSTFRYRFDLQD